MVSWAINSKPNNLIYSLAPFVKWIVIVFNAGVVPKDADTVEPKFTTDPDLTNLSFNGVSTVDLPVAVVLPSVSYTHLTLPTKA